MGHDLNRELLREITFEQINDAAMFDTVAGFPYLRPLINSACVWFDAFNDNVVRT